MPSHYFSCTSASPKLRSGELTMSQALASLKSVSPRRKRRTHPHVLRPSDSQPPLPPLNRYSNAARHSLPSPLLNTSLKGQGIAMGRKSAYENQSTGFWHPAKASCVPVTKYRSPILESRSTQRELEPSLNTSKNEVESDGSSALPSREKLLLPVISPSSTKSNVSVTPSLGELCYWQGQTFSGAHFAVCAHTPPKTKTNSEKTDLSVFHLLQTEVLPTRFAAGVLPQKERASDLFTCGNMKKPKGAVVTCPRKDIELNIAATMNASCKLPAPATIDLVEHCVGEPMTTCAISDWPGMSSANSVGKQCPGEKEIREHREFDCCPWQQKDNMEKGESQPPICYLLQSRGTPLREPPRKDKQGTLDAVDHLPNIRDEFSFETMLDQVGVTFPQPDGVSPEQGRQGRQNSPYETESSDDDESSDSETQPVTWIKRGLSSEDVNCGCEMFESQTDGTIDQPKSECPPPKVFKRPPAAAIYFDSVNTMPIKMADRRTVMARLTRTPSRCKLPKLDKKTCNTDQDTKDIGHNVQPQKQPMEMNKVYLRIRCIEEPADAVKPQTRPILQNSAWLRRMHKSLKAKSDDNTNVNSTTRRHSPLSSGKNRTVPGFNDTVLPQDFDNPKSHIVIPSRESRTSNYSDTVKDEYHTINHTTLKDTLDDSIIERDERTADVQDNAPFHQAKEGLMDIQTQEDRQGALSAAPSFNFHCNSPVLFDHLVVEQRQEADNQLSPFSNAQQAPSTLSVKGWSSRFQDSGTDVPSGSECINNVQAASATTALVKTNQITSQTSHSRSILSSSSDESIFSHKSDNAASEMSALHIDNNRQDQSDYRSAQVQCKSSRYNAPSTVELSGSLCRDAINIVQSVNYPATIPENLTLTNISTSDPKTLCENYQGKQDLSAFSAEYKPTVNKSVRFADVHPNVICGDSSDKKDKNMSFHPIYVDVDGRPLGKPTNSCYSHGSGGDDISKIRYQALARSYLAPMQHLPSDGRDASEDLKRPESTTSGTSTLSAFPPNRYLDREAYLQRLKKMDMPFRDYFDDILVKGERMVLLDAEEGTGSIPVDAPVVQYGVCTKCCTGNQQVTFISHNGSGDIT